MKKRLKKKYERPTVTKVRLEAKVSVLGLCKRSDESAGGPVVNCNDLLGDPCETDGS
jgi:hypothetical protein